MSRRSNDKTRKNIVIGSGVAALAGFLVGLLSAPKSGRQTREDIKVAADKGRREAEAELKSLHTDLNSAIKQAKDKGANASKKSSIEIKKRIEVAIETKEKVREILSAIHEGDADDQDLKRAVKNASSALEHLKDYIKK
ncbi:MAG TPA: YtxH domain-containing protein [Candidatus Saccharimonadales bacterium]|nr:YtxH domain-containing protein [Candidatus Saccharimonadales bacterium]